MELRRPEDFELVIHEIMRMSFHLDGRAIARHGITVGQCHLIFLIKERGEMTMSELAEALGVTTGAATGFISRMLKRGMVKRYHDKQDRRRVLVRATSRGEGVLGEMMRIKRKRLAKVLAGVSAAERRGFGGVLSTVQAQLRKEMKEVKKK